MSKLLALSVVFEKLDGGTFWAAIPGLPVSGYGETLGDALQALGAFWDAQWEALVEAPESDLTEHAKKVRRAFLEATAGWETGGTK